MGHVTLTLWTADPALARRADRAGVDRIGVDVDTLGKRTRQRDLGTWISPHSLDELPAVGAVIARAQLFARLNPLHDRTEHEVETAVAAGARVLMLPMFRCAGDLERFATLVAGRATVVGLLETREALAAIDEVVHAPGLDELHVGINDLGIGLGVANRFEVLALDELAYAADAARAAGRRFGAGGIGRVGTGGMPIDPDLVYAQLGRLRVDAALLARSFVTGLGDLAAEIRNARERLAWWSERPGIELDDARATLRAAARRPGMAF